MKDMPIPQWVCNCGQPVAWICQPPRSGGTLLLRLFDGHPQTHCHPGVFGFDTERRIWPDVDEIEQYRGRVFDLFNYMNLEKFNRVGIKKKSSNMTQERYPIYFDSDWYQEIFGWKLTGLERSLRTLFNAFWTALFNSWRNNQNLYGAKRYIVGQMTLADPSLYSHNYANFISTYPDGVMLYVVRDPLDWLASAFNLKHSTDYADKTPQEIIGAYKTYLRQAINLSASPSFILLKFEELALQPRETMESLAEQLALVWDDSLLHPTVNRSPAYQNSSFALDRKSTVDPSVVGRGAQLPPELRAAVDDECRELYQRAIGG